MGLHDILVVMNFGKAGRVWRWSPAAVDWSMRGGVMNYKEEAENFPKKLTLKRGERERAGQARLRPESINTSPQLNALFSFTFRNLGVGAKKADIVGLAQDWVFPDDCYGRTMGQANRDFSNRGVRVTDHVLSAEWTGAWVLVGLREYWQLVRDAGVAAKQRCSWMKTEFIAAPPDRIVIFWF